MRKKIVVLLMTIFVLAVSLVRADILPGGKGAIFRRNGTRIVGDIVDISRTRLVLQLKDGTEIKLSAVWMINFVNKEWDFPNERKQIEENQHFLFLKNGDIISGKIVDFSSTRRVFELEAGENVGFGSLKRIYFMKNIPVFFKEKLKEKEIKKKVKKKIKY